MNPITCQRLANLYGRPIYINKKIDERVVFLSSWLFWECRNLKGLSSESLGLISSNIILDAFEHSLKSSNDIIWFLPKKAYRKKDVILYNNPQELADKSQCAILYSKDFFSISMFELSNIDLNNLPKYRSNLSCGDNSLGEFSGIINSEFFDKDFSEELIWYLPK